ncbi:hypothetical protein GNI_134260 [Gregarina niphandrodes]|uniref:Uncharacterized protein n=1 Tax=Gregarina niphandrodes TaxID=110365 RepID=A0A023B108_GRENI|nr:hypothetical protein GNI_134260 [Gregarina niphandrodes]EZG46252.1 hypothetical protein GNI_134260 [Gregarina niphandrodes]|eukprot:XP_011132322.1 hypothetical protein GNI_134260 [Gregarina niphandrodes]
MKCIRGRSDRNVWLAGLSLPFMVNGELGDIVNILEPLCASLEPGIKARLGEGLILLHDLPDKTVGWMDQSGALLSLSAEELLEAIVSNDALGTRFCELIADCLFAIEGLIERNPESCGINQELRLRLRHWTQLATNDFGWYDRHLSHATQYEDLHFFLDGAYLISTTVANKLSKFVIPVVFAKNVSLEENTSQKVAALMQKSWRAVEQSLQQLPAHACAVVYLETDDDGLVKCTADPDVPIELWRAR